MEMEMYSRNVVEYILEPRSQFRADVLFGMF